jgi:hypothetical protein
METLTEFHPREVIDILKLNHSGETIILHDIIDMHKRDSMASNAPKIFYNIIDHWDLKSENSDQKLIDFLFNKITDSEVCIFDIILDGDELESDSLAKGVNEFMHDIIVKLDPFPLDGTHLQNFCRSIFGTAAEKGKTCQIDIISALLLASSNFPNFKEFILMQIFEMTRIKSENNEYEARKMLENTFGQSPRLLNDLEQYFPKSAPNDGE